jgi:hypothetical protein
MVIYYVIKGFLVHNVLTDTCSAADIMFAKAFRQMQEQNDKIHDATHPLCGFGGRQCWYLLSAARKPTRVNSGDNRVTCSGAIALLI